MRRRLVSTKLTLGLTLAACSGGGGTQPQSATGISGTVTSSDYAPISGAKVALRGPSGGWLTTTTNAQGGFSIPPFDGGAYLLAVASPGRIDFWDGVTSRGTIQARLPVYSSTTNVASLTAPVTGDCGGGGCPPAGEGWGGRMFFAGDVGMWQAALFAPNQPTTTPYAPTWTGATTANGSLYALYWTCPTSCPSNPPDGYWGALQDGVSLTANGSTTVAALPLSPLPASPLTMNVATNGAAASVWVGFSYDGSSYMLNQAGSAPAGSVTVPVPVATGLRTMVQVQLAPPSGGTATAGWVGDAAPAAAVDAGLHLVPALVEPASGATGVGPGTRFSWSGEPGVLSSVEARPTSSGGTVVRVNTNAASFVVPDLTALGVSLGSGTSYSWTVRAYSTSAVDGLLKPVAVPPPTPTGTSQFWSASSAARTFTTM